MSPKASSKVPITSSQSDRLPFQHATLFLENTIFIQINNLELLSIISVLDSNSQLITLGTASCKSRWIKTYSLSMKSVLLTNLLLLKLLCFISILCNLDCWACLTMKPSLHFMLLFLFMGYTLTLEPIHTMKCFASELSTWCVRWPGFGAGDYNRIPDVSRVNTLSLILSYLQWFLVNLSHFSSNILQLFPYSLSFLLKDEAKYPFNNWTPSKLFWVSLWPSAHTRSSFFFLFLSAWLKISSSWLKETGE